MFIRDAGSVDQADLGGIPGIAVGKPPVGDVKRERIVAVVQHRQLHAVEKIPIPQPVGKVGGQVWHLLQPRARIAVEPA